MAEKDGRKRSVKRPAPASFSGAWKGFVDLNLSEAEREECSHLVGQVMAMLEDIVNRWLELEHRLSFTRDVVHGCVIAALTCRDEESENVGYTMTARGPGFAEALTALWYKDDQLCGGGAWLSSQEARKDQQLSMWG